MPLANREVDPIEKQDGVVSAVLNDIATDSDTQRGNFKVKASWSHGTICHKT